MLIVVLCVTFFVLAFMADMMQFWVVITSPAEAKRPMVWGPLKKFFFRFSGVSVDRYMLASGTWFVGHVIVLGLAYGYIKIAGGWLVLSVLCAALGLFYGQLYLRRRKV